MTKPATARRLNLAFAIQLGLIVLLIAISLVALNTISSHVQRIVMDSNVKVRLASVMLHSARERNLLLFRMVLIEDPFERDELALQLDRHGANFAQARLRLLAMPLSPRERSMLTEQGRLTGIAVPLQRQVIDLAAADQLQEAKRLLTQTTMPAQDAVLDQLNALIELQNDNAFAAGREAAETHRRVRNTVIVLGAALLALGLINARIFTRRITGAEQVLYKEKEKALVTFRSIGDAVITTDAGGRVEYINEIAELLTGIASGRAPGARIEDIFRAYDADRQQPVAELIQGQLRGETTQPSANVELSAFDNSRYSISARLSPIRGVSDVIEGLVITFHDVTQSREMMQRIKYQATHDALTGLLNRHAFERKVQQALSLYDPEAGHAFCIVDLDRFKVVNDSCGHQAGDQLLQQLSGHLRSKMRKGDLMARLGGDEFAVFLSNIDTDQAQRVAGDLLDTINEFRFLWQDKTFRIGASIGLVSTTGEVADYDFLYHSADTACFIAKDEGRNRVHLMAVDGSERARRKEETDWVEAINHALDQDGFQLYGQPIVPLSARAADRPHLEMLVRMIGSDGRVILPMSFIPVAERYGLMSKVDETVMRKACQLVRDTPLDRTVYNVNLSGQTLSSDASMRTIAELVREMDVPAGRLCLEITETAAIANLENAISFLRDMRDLGCFCALDDFGSGLSSFTYLKDLPLDFIKIDGSFVKNMLEQESSEVMVDAIHNVGKKLGLMTVAEYVENADIAALLQRIGVDFAQGYHFGAPRPIAEYLLRSDAADTRNSPA